MKSRKYILLFTLLVLLIGVASATEVSEDTVTTVDNTSVDEVVEEADTLTNTVNNTVTEKQYENNKITKEEKNVKTASKTYNVNDFDTLHTALTSDAYDTVTVSVKSNIILNQNTTLNNVIKQLTINGNGKIIDGKDKYQFLDINSCHVKINNITIKNCNARGGAAINTKASELILTNSNFNNNSAVFGGAILTNDNSTIKINHCNFTYNGNNKQTSLGQGAAIYCYGNTTINIDNSNIMNNTESAYAIGTSHGLINLTINNSKLSNNLGGISISNLYDVVIEETTTQNIIICNCNFTNNSDLDINAVTNLNINNSNFNNNENGIRYHNGTTTINNSIFNNNSRTGIIGRGNTKIINTIVSNNQLGGLSLSDDANLTNCTIKNNKLLEDPNNKQSFIGEGGGICQYSGILNLNECNISNNIAKSGGAVYSAVGLVRITNCNFTNNNVSHGGGAITTSFVNMTIKNSIFKNNNAKTGGGAIDILNSNTTITNITLNNNKGVGGAIYIWTCNFTIDNCDISNNYGGSDREHGGGAIYIGSSNYGIGGSKIKINNSNICNNRAYEHAGAVMADNGCENLTITNSNISNNYANIDGGAICTNTTSKIYIDNCNLVNNTARKNGGAIYSYRRATITNSILKNNKAVENGGAVYSYSDFLIMERNVLINNTAIQGSAIMINETLIHHEIDLYNNIINNTFKQNMAKTSGNAIINNGNATIINNTNADISKYNGTIYTNGKNVQIRNNIFDDGIAYTKTIVKTTKGIIGEKLTLIATVTDTTNKKVNEGNLIFKLNGITIKDNGKLSGSSNPLKIKVTNGVATATVIPDISMRNADKLTATYIGTTNYNASVSNTAKTQISQRNASIVVSSNVKAIKQGQVLALTAKVYDTTNGKKSTNLVNYADEFVYFKVNGITLKDSKGNMLKVKIVNGTATAKYTIPLGLSGVTDGKTMTPKNHTILVGFYNKNYHENIRNTSTFQVERSNITITIANATVYNKTHKLSLTATIKDYLGNIVAGPNKCVIKINGMSLKNGTQPMYYYSTNGILTIKNITIPLYSTYKTIEIVTQDRLAYKSQRNTTSTIKVLK